MIKRVTIGLCSQCFLAGALGISPARSPISQIGKSRHAPLHFQILRSNPKKMLEHYPPNCQINFNPAKCRNTSRQIRKSQFSLPFYISIFGQIWKIRVLFAGQNMRGHRFILLTTDLDHNLSSKYQLLFSKTISVHSCGITVSRRSDVLSCFIDFPQLLSLNTEPTDNTRGIALLSFSAP